MFVGIQPTNLFQILRGFMLGLKLFSNLIYIQTIHLEKISRHEGVNSLSADGKRHMFQIYWLTVNSPRQYTYSARNTPSNVYLSLGDNNFFSRPGQNSTFPCMTMIKACFHIAIWSLVLGPIGFRNYPFTSVHMCVCGGRGGGDSGVFWPGLPWHIKWTTICNNFVYRHFFSHIAA